MLLRRTPSSCARRGLVSGGSSADRVRGPCRGAGRGLRAGDWSRGSGDPDPCWRSTPRRSPRAQLVRGGRPHRRQVHDPSIAPRTLPTAKALLPVSAPMAGIVENNVIAARPGKAHPRCMSRRVTFVSIPLPEPGSRRPARGVRRVDRFFGDQIRVQTTESSLRRRLVRSSSGLEVPTCAGHRWVRGSRSTRSSSWGVMGSRAAEHDDELVRRIAHRGRSAPAGSRSVQLARSWCSGTWGDAPRHERPTHGRTASGLPRRPRDHGRPDPIFVRDGAVWTSAGVTARHGPCPRADRRGRRTEVRARRTSLALRPAPGGQSAVQTQLAAQRRRRRAAAPLQGMDARRPATTTCRSPDSRARSGMSERCFAPAFRPRARHDTRCVRRGRAVESSESRLLETTTDSIEAIARSCGFGTVETMHRTFKRTVRVTPGDYRRHFHPHAAA